MNALTREGARYGFAPLMLASIIETESDFSITQHGRHGELGLMQVKPATARWVAGRMGFAWEGPKTLLDPAKNIRIGAAYLALLRDEFPAKRQLYLSAYNMGANNLRRALRNRIMPVNYSSRILAHYRAFYFKAPLAGDPA
jgi:soluble lytic murein transglycosylase